MQMMGRKKFGEVLMRDAEKMKLKSSALGARCACAVVCDDTSCVCVWGGGGAGLEMAH